MFPIPYGVYTLVRDSVNVYFGKETRIFRKYTELSQISTIFTGISIVIPAEIREFRTISAYICNVSADILLFPEKYRDITVFLVHLGIIPADIQQIREYVLLLAYLRVILQIW